MQTFYLGTVLLITFVGKHDRSRAHKFNNYNKYKIVIGTID